MNAPPSPAAGERERRMLLWALAAALVWRWVLAMRTPVPAEDGANYLWMAERFAAGDFAGPLGEVFPPLLSLLIAVPVALGLEPLLAGQLVCCLGGALALVPVARIAERLQPGSGPWAAALMVTAALPARVCAEVQSESLFLLVSALAIGSGLRQRHWSLGLWAGLAFWLRPEGLVLPAAFLLGGERRAWRALLMAALFVAALSLWRGIAGHGFDPVPKWSFHLQRDDLPERGDVLGNLLQIPWLFVEAYGPMALLAVWGVLRGHSRRLRPLYWIWGLGLLAICTFVARRRFLVSWTAALVPLAVLGLFRLPQRFRSGMVALLVLYGALVSWRGVTAPDRIAERLVGEYLARSLAPDEDVAGDMTRVIWFAGRRPLPPRHFSAEQLVARARRPGVRYVVLRSRHPDSARVVQELGGEFATLVLPPELQGPAEARGITVLVRR